jgi:hypothetical protein
MNFEKSERGQNLYDHRAMPERHLFDEITGSIPDSPTSWIQFPEPVVVDCKQTIELNGDSITQFLSTLPNQFPEHPETTT